MSNKSLFTMKTCSLRSKHVPDPRTSEVGNSNTLERDHKNSRSRYSALHSPTEWGKKAETGIRNKQGHKPRRVKASDLDSSRLLYGTKGVNTGSSSGYRGGRPQLVFTEH